MSIIAAFLYLCKNMHIEYTKGNYMAVRNLNLKLSVIDVILIAGVGYVGYQNILLGNKLNAITTFIENTSKLADKKITEMAMLTYQSSGPYEQSDYKNAKKIVYGVGTVGALRLTEKIKSAVGKVAKIVVTPDEARQQYQVAIGERIYVATGDEKYLVISDIKIPLGKEEYKIFRKSDEYKKLGRMLGKEKEVKSFDDEFEQSSNAENLQSNINDSSNTLLMIKELFPIGLPGIASALDTLSERKAVLEEAAPYMLKYEGINSHTSLYVAFDISCPYCKEFFKTIPELQEAGYTLNLMMIDKSRKYASSKAKIMQTLYCKENPVDALNKAMRGNEPISAPCEKGVKFLESMTNAAILAGTQATPSMFNQDGVPLYTFNPDKNKYNPEYRLSRIQDILKRINDYR
jgi:hypothetical protein